MLMVFPEGARGTAKLYKERYSLVDFGTGFMRLALKTKTPIVPFAFLGGGEAIPTDLQRRTRSASSLGVPYVPDHAVAASPCRSRRSSRSTIGEPMVFEGTGAEEDEVIDGHVEKVKERIARAHRRRAPSPAAARPREQRAHEGPRSPASPGELGKHRSRERLHRARATRSSASIAARGATRPRGVEVHEVDIRKRAAEDVFRKRRARGRDPHGDGHAPRRAAARSATASTSAARARCSSTRATYGVEHVDLRRPPHLLRRRAPTRRSTTPRTSRRWALASFPELADLVAADLYAGSALWRYPSFATAVLRMCLHARPDGPRHARDVPPRHARADGARLRSALPVHARAGRRRAPSARRSRSGCAASSTSPGRSRCRSRWSSARPGARNMPLPEIALRDACSAASGCPKLPRGRARAHQVPGRGRRRARSGRRPASRTRSTRGRDARVPRRVSAPVALTDDGALRGGAGPRARLMPAGSAAASCAARCRAAHGSFDPHISMGPRYFRRNLPVTDPSQAWLGFCNRWTRAAVLETPSSPRRVPPPLRRPGGRAAGSLLEPDPRVLRAPVLRAAARTAHAAAGVRPPGRAHALRLHAAPAASAVRPRNDLSAPPPPHSLAPMAMSADSTGRQFATTGFSRTQGGTMSGREKPSLKWGVMIALSGALLGGVLGLGMDARRQSARAAAAPPRRRSTLRAAMVATALPSRRPSSPS